MRGELPFEKIRSAVRGPEEKRMGEAAMKLEHDAETGENARKAARAAVHVHIDVSSEHNFWSGLSMNMSEGGVFVATHRLVPIGTVLTLDMDLPNHDEPISVLAEVRWTRAYTGQDDVPPGLGLQFVDLDDAALAIVRRFVSTTREPLFFDD